MSEQRKLHILQVNKAYYPHIGGIESLVRTFSRELQKRAEVKVLVCQEKGKGEDRVVEGVPVHYASSLGTYFSCPLSFSFLRKFREMAKWADVVEFHVPFPLADLACLLSGYRGGVVIAWHSDVVRQKTLLRFYKPLLMKFLRRADCIIAATEGHITSSPFLTQFREKCRIIPYGIDVQAYRSVERKPILRQVQQNPETVRVLFVGRFVYYKGIEVLLHAFAGVHGCEDVGILALQKLVETLDCTTLFGQVILLPLVNSKGFFAGVKQLNPADDRNLNREFPGREDGTETQRMAWAIEKLLYPEADFLLDLHGGDWNEELAPLVFFPCGAGQKVEQETRRAAQALSVSMRVCSTARNGSYSWAAQKGIPALLLERGGNGRWTSEEVDADCEDVLRLMNHLGIIKENFGVIRQTEIAKAVYDEALEDGYWFPEVLLQ